MDSEGLCNQAFLDLLPDLDDTSDSLTARYRGLKLAHILEDLEVRLQCALPPDFERRYRERVAELFARDLKATPGTHEMLCNLRFARCVASSGPEPKIIDALQTSGLWPHFGDRIYSSYDVGSWKPDPGLFLHAAQSMGYAPCRCVVVEDSEVGLDAASAAGMRALHYSPETTPGEEETDSVFSHMLELPRLIARFG